MQQQDYWSHTSILEGTTGIRKRWWQWASSAGLWDLLDAGDKRTGRTEVLTQHILMIYSNWAHSKYVLGVKYGEIKSKVLKYYSETLLNHFFNHRWAVMHNWKIFVQTVTTVQLILTEDNTSNTQNQPTAPFYNLVLSKNDSKEIVLPLYQFHQSFKTQETSVRCFCFD